MRCSTPTPASTLFTNKIMNITEEMLDSISSKVGYAPGGWCEVDPRELVNAIVESVVFEDAEIPPPTQEEFLEAFRKEVDDKFKEPDSADYQLYSEADFHSITAGWGMANGMTPKQAHEFATFVRYKTDMA